MRTIYKSMQLLREGSFREALLVKIGSSFIKAGLSYILESPILSVLLDPFWFNTEADCPSFI